jgi:hypothetical protein
MDPKTPEKLGMKAMKTAVLGFCFLCATGAFGQSVGSAIMSSVIQMTSHAEQASQHAMAPEQSLMEHSGFSYAQGERPLWEVQPLSQARPVPLGDIARMLRKEHETCKKADIVVNQ